jgi:hypothetical protein
MSLNRHNPFVASLSSLVEPAPAAPASPEAHKADTAIAAETGHPTMLERFESWAAFGQTLGAEPDKPAAELPDESAIELARRKLSPYFY